MGCDAVNDRRPIDDLGERLATIERAVDSGAYVPGSWQRWIADLRRVPPTKRAALADDVSRVSRKFHLRQRRYTGTVVPGLCIESFAATLGGILFALAVVHYQTHLRLSR